jgi:ribosome-associated protein
MLATVHDHLTVRGSIAIPRRELSWRFSRSSGPGGQSVNTADSRVELRWDLVASSALPPPLKERALARLAGRLVDGAIVVTAQESRAQLHNRRAAETRLVALVADAIAPGPPKRRATKPSKGSAQRRLDAKRQRGLTKHYRRHVGD